MLLQKTSWRIKQFISHRKDASHEKPGNNLDGEGMKDIKLSSNHRRHSWLSQTPPSEVTTPLLRPNRNATSRSLHLGIPESSTAHSSASSLCSCDCGPDPNPKEDSLSKPSKPQADTLYLPSSTPSTTSGDLKRWQSMFSDPFAKSLVSVVSNADSNTSSASTIAGGSMLDLKEALGEIDPMDNDKTPTQSIKFRDESDMQLVSDNVEQLIRETDEAFQAVGSILAEVKTVSHDWYDDEDAPIVRNFAVSRSVARKPPRTPASLIKPTMGRNISVTKTKAKKTKFIKRRTNIFGRTLKNVPPPPANTPSRWTLTDVTTNMADVFSGKMFRTEVDEMLTPGRMQKLKEEKIENERPSSKDSSRSGETDGSTPTEPFHLESLSSRISAALNKSPTPAPDEGPSKTALPQQRNAKVKFSTLSVNAPETAMTINDFTFPSPPRTPRRPSGSRGGAPLLPTIPEVSPLSLPLLRPSTSPSSKTRLQPPSPPQQQQRFILLPSPSITLLSPLYLHGCIRVSLPLPLPISARKTSSILSSPDGEPLDWTAFQMAISGTMAMEFANVKQQQEKLLDGEEEEWEAEEVEIDELVEWFESLGFWKDGVGLGYGMLVDEKMSLSLYSSKYPSPSPSQPQPQTPNPPNIPPPKPETERRPSTKSTNSDSDSLPPSPMLDLALLGEEDVIPMGFNLGHDLGDFLEWEVRNVRVWGGDD